MTSELMSLRENLTQSRACLRRMIALLEEESACLTQRDAAGLERIAMDKLALLPDLESLDRERRRVLCDSATGREPLTVRAWLARHVVDDETQQILWEIGDEVCELGLAARRQNELNGVYIALLRHHTQACLDILSGPAATETTYGPDGGTRRGTPSARSFSV